MAEHSCLASISIFKYEETRLSFIELSVLLEMDIHMVNNRLIVGQLRYELELNKTIWCATGNEQNRLNNMRNVLFVI